MSQRRYTSFETFWPFYLGEHAVPATRAWHFVGTSLGLLNWILALVWLKPWMLLTGLATGYAFAWVSHFFIEKNRPATFTYPLWSFMGDWKMWGLTLTGKLGQELEKHHVGKSSQGTQAEAA